MSRRDNGLSAPSYTRLDDVGTHLVDELLDRLGQAGVAAYSAPTPGRRGAYGETVPPLGPSDSVFVDSARRDIARTVTDTLLREVRDDLAWADIVAGFDTETAEGHEQPAADDGPTIGFEVLRANTPTSPVVAQEGTIEAALPAGDEDHFEPPPPPPLPQVDRIGRFAWAGAVGGPLVLLLATLLGAPLDGWAGFLALAASMGGFVTLVARMKDRPPTDTGPDDGAVV